MLIGLERLAPLVPFNKLTLKNAIVVVVEGSHKPGSKKSRRGDGREVYLSAYLTLINIGMGVHGVCPGFDIP